MDDAAPSCGKATIKRLYDIGVCGFVGLLNNDTKADLDRLIQKGLVTQEGAHWSARVELTNDGRTALSKGPQA